MDRRTLKFIGIGALIMCVIVFIISVTSCSSRKKQSAEEVDNYLASDLVHVSSDTELSNSETESNVTAKSDTDTYTDSASDETGLPPADCNSDFWRVKMGIAECYDHIFKKGHMIDDTAYYSGSCDNHDLSQIQALARKVKLYREINEDGSFSYSATLPEIGWTIMLYDENIKAIIDSQIAETSEIMSEDISIVMYFYDNTLQIEIAE